MPHAVRKALQNYNKFFKFANFFVKKYFFLAFGIQHSAFGFLPECSEAPDG